MREGVDERRLDEAQDSLYDVEHGGSWLMALAAIGLGVIGALTGFEVLDLRDAAAELPGIGADENVASIFGNNFWDAAMLLFSAMTAAALAYCLHANDHHRLRDLSTVRASDRNMWTMEHTLAYLFAFGSIGFVVIGLLTGFGAFDQGHDQRDGLIWIWLGFGSSLLTTALHAVRHHQAVEEDYIISIVEGRVGATAARGPVSTPRPERLR